jgi:hypothetical protein
MNIIPFQDDPASFRFPETVLTFPRERPRIRYREYQVWNGMMQRCYNRTRHNYRFYGATGIRVCERWHDLRKFVHDVTPRPSDKHTLDRWPDKYGNYAPTNFRWATRFEQGANCRNNIMVTFRGRTQTLPEWCTELNLNRALTWQRLFINAWDIELAFATKAA